MTISTLSSKEKDAIYTAKYRANNPEQTILSWAYTKYKPPPQELRQIIPQELIDVKLLQLALHRLIKEKGLNNEPERI